MEIGGRATAATGGTRGTRGETSQVRGAAADSCANSQQQILFCDRECQSDGHQARALSTVDGCGHTGDPVGWHAVHHPHTRANPPAHNTSR